VKTPRQLGQANSQAESSGAAVEAALVVLLVAEGMLPMLTDRQLSRVLFVLHLQQKSLHRCRGHSCNVGLGRIIQNGKVCRNAVTLIADVHSAQEQTVWADHLRAALVLASSTASPALSADLEACCLARW